MQAWNSPGAGQTAAAGTSAPSYSGDPLSPAAPGSSRLRLSLWSHLFLGITDDVFFAAAIKLAERVGGGEKFTKHGKGSHCF